MNASQVRPLRYAWAARSTDEVREYLTHMYVLPESEAAVGADGFVVHAVRTRIPVECAVDLNDTSLILNGNAASGIEMMKTLEDVRAGLKDKAEITLSVGLLRRALDQMDETDYVRVAVLTGKDKPMALEIFGRIDGDDAYALVMAMREDEGNKRHWTPLRINGKAKG